MIDTKHNWPRSSSVTWVCDHMAIYMKAITRNQNWSQIKWNICQEEIILEFLHMISNTIVCQVTFYANCSLIYFGMLHVSLFLFMFLSTRVVRKISLENRDNARAFNIVTCSIYLQIRKPWEEGWSVEIVALDFFGAGMPARRHYPSWSGCCGCNARQSCGSAGRVEHAPHVLLIGPQLQYFVVLCYRIFLFIHLIKHQSTIRNFLFLIWVFSLQYSLGGIRHSKVAPSAFPRTLNCEIDSGI